MRRARLSAARREVLTFSLGEYAGFVNTHFWNLQDLSPHDPLLGFPESEVSRDVLFRAGETRSGDATRTPRAVVLDVKGALGGLSKAAGGGGYQSMGSMDPSSDPGTWGGD
eukprot:SAG22_NODE_7364_length_747_cov_1.120370_1_plen_110_part_01